MSIAAKLAGALLVSLLIHPVAARAASLPPKQVISGAAVNASLIARTSAFIQGEAQGQGNQLPAKKKKKPQFQTRFFGE